MWLFGRSKAALLAVIGLETAVLIGATQAEEPPSYGPAWRLTATVNYSSGSYGTDTTTKIYYAPVTLRRMFRDGDVSVTVPFVMISGTGAVRLVGGVPTRTGTTASLAGVPSGGAGGGKGPGSRPLSSPTTDSGLGDIILRGRYYVTKESDFVPLVALTGRVKLPTADAGAGLGTGEFDEGAGLEFTKEFGDRWLGYLDGGYNVIGDAPGVNFNDQWWYDVGIGHEVTDNLHMSLFYEEYRALVNTVNNARDLLALTNYIVNDMVHLTGSLLVGLSNGAPNYGLGIGIRFRF